MTESLHFMEINGNILVKSFVCFLLASSLGYPGYPQSYVRSADVFNEENIAS